MGAEQSTRKITIDNNEDADVIKVSHSVVERLTHKANQNGASANEVRPSSEPQLNKAVPQSPQSGVPVPSGYPVYYYPELTLTALEIQQQKEKELRNQDQYWQNRMINLEKNHLKINRIIDEEYKKASKELYTDGMHKINIILL